MIIRHELRQKGTGAKSGWRNHLLLTIALVLLIIFNSFQGVDNMNNFSWYCAFSFSSVVNTVWSIGCNMVSSALFA